MTRTGQDAIDYARSRVGDYYPPGYCLQFTRECFLVPALYASAVDAWYATNDPHPGDRNPPPAVPVWFKSPSVYRHVAFHAGGGEVITTFNDEVRSMSLSAMESSFGPYAGWAEDLNEVRVWSPAPAPIPEPEPEPTIGDDMPHLFHQVFTDGRQAYVYQGTVVETIISGEYAAAVAKGYDIEAVEVNEYDWNAISDLHAQDVQALRQLLNPG